MRSRYPLLLGLSLLLVACPGPQGPQGGSPDPAPTPDPSPDPTPSSQEVQGRLLDLATGKPLAGATVLLADRALTPASDGRFSATLPTASKGHAATILADGYVPLTVYGYGGGPLFMRPKAPLSLERSTVTLSLQAPPGASSEAVLAIAVKPPGASHASTAYLGTSTFSPLGTASATASLPAGEATVLAYGTKGTVVGSLQAPVSTALSLTLKAIDGYELYQAAVPKFRPDGGTLQMAAFSLVWPGETPEMPSTLGLGVVAGETTNRPIALPPASAFGLANAAYAVTGSALSNGTPRVTLAERTVSNAKPGAFEVPLLSEPTGQLLAGAFGLLPGSSAGATAYYADVLDPTTQAPLWRLVSLGKTPARLTLPELPATLQAWRLAKGKSYLLQGGAAEGLLGFKASKAFAQGPSFTVTLPSGAQP